MELAKKPIWFLCLADAVTWRVSVPKTGHSFLFYKGRPHLIHFVLDIEFLDEHQMFKRFEEEEPDMPEPEVTSPPRKKTKVVLFSRKELQKMRKSDVREILRGLSPDTSSPVRKENIIKAILKVQ